MSFDVCLRIFVSNFLVNPATLSKKRDFEAFRNREHFPLKACNYRLCWCLRMEVAAFIFKRTAHGITKYCSMNAKWISVISRSVQRHWEMCELRSNGKTHWHCKVVASVLQFCNAKPRPEQQNRREDRTGPCGVTPPPDEYPRGTHMSIWNEIQFLFPLWAGLRRRNTTTLQQHLLSTRCCSKRTWVPGFCCGILLKLITIQTTNDNYARTDLQERVWSWKLRTNLLSV